jgi:hypothetical protein
MRRLLLIVGLSLVLAPAALAKGPDYATLKGPGLDHPARFDGEEGGTTTALGRLATYAGFYQLAYGFGQDPTGVLNGRPKGDLGPRYLIRYSVPGPSGRAAVVSEVYPYAKPAVAHMRRGQRFMDGMQTRGGWFQGGAALKQTLVSAGLPKTAPQASSGFWTGERVASLVAIAFLLGALLLAASPWRRGRAQRSGRRHVDAPII